MLRVLLKVTDKGDYDWVECGACETGWQVPHNAESVGLRRARCRTHSGWPGEGGVLCGQKLLDGVGSHHRSSHWGDGAGAHDKVTTS
jgi:hypothetical protein